MLRLGVELPGAAAGRGRGAGAGCGIDGSANDDRGNTGCDGAGCALASGPTGIA
jgi:hypothetical protein